MYINLHSHEQSKISFSSQSHWHILFLIFLIIAMLIGVRWHLLLLKVSGVKHFFKHLLSTFMFVFFWQMHIQAYCSFLNVFLEDFLSILQFLIKFACQTLARCMNCQYFHHLVDCLCILLSCIVQKI